MGKATVYCEKCGDMIPEKDFESGRAVTVQGKHYCPKCRKSVEHLLPPPGTPVTPVPISKKSSGIVPSVRNPVRKPHSSGIVRAVGSPATGRTSKHQALRPPTPSQVIKKKSSGFRIAVESDIPPAEDDGAEGTPSRAPVSRKQSEKRTALYAAIAGGLVLLLAGGFIWNKSAKERQAREVAEAKARAADEAWKAILDLRKTLRDKPDQVLVMLGDKKIALAGSKYESDSKALEKDLKAEITEQAYQAKLSERFAELQAQRESGDIESLKKDLTALRKSDRIPDSLKSKIDLEVLALTKLGMQRRLDQAELYDSGHQREYDKSIDTYTDIMTDCEAPELQDFRTRAQIKKDDVVTRREADANSSYEEIRRRVEEMLGDHHFDQAFEATREFDTLTFGMTPAKGRIEQLQARISKEKEEFARSQQPPPGGTPPDGTPPGGEPAGPAVTLFNGKDTSGWQVNGSTVEWKVENGEMVGRSKLSDPPPKFGAQGTINIDNIFFPPGRMGASYEMEVEVSLNKGAFAVLVHYDGAKAIGLTRPFDSSVLTGMLNTWITARIRVENKNVSITVGGMPAGSAPLDPGAPATGTIGFTVFGSSEFRIRKAVLTPLK
ncbi:MAG: hypothetical protein HYY93_01425 [Planctomycetes bacterium]|nr:hypothetical protein [Planctomycetota bacterium]